MDFLKNILDTAYKDVRPPYTIDKKLLHQIHEYQLGFAHKNEEHIKFFGGNLLGVHSVRFTTSDKNIWIDDIVRLEEYDIRQQVVAPETAFREEWVRVTDVMNLSCLYLCHRIYNSTLPEKDKTQGMLDVLLVLHYKFISSLMAHYFNKAPANEATALAVYAALSKKYAIKQHGSWHAMLVARCMDIIDERSIHFQTIAKFDDDAAIIYMITDTQGRARSIVKKQYKVFVEVRAQNAKITSVGGHVQLESGLTVKDVSRLYQPYRRYLNEIIVDRKAFIKIDLLEVIGSAMHTMPEKLLLDALEYMVAHHRDKLVEDVLTETMLHAFDYLSRESSARLAMRDIGLLISKLRALYMASRSSDPALMRMRDLGEKLVDEAIISKSSSTIASVRTGVFLYIVLRVFSRRHYG